MPSRILSLLASQFSVYSLSKTLMPPSFVLSPTVPQTGADSMPSRNKSRI